MRPCVEYFARYRNNGHWIGEGDVERGESHGGDLRPGVRHNLSHKSFLPRDFQDFLQNLKIYQIN